MIIRTWNLQGMHQQTDYTEYYIFKCMFNRNEEKHTPATSTEGGKCNKLCVHNIC
jgi:hypothetical protein